MITAMYIVLSVFAYIFMGTLTHAVTTKLLGKYYHEDLILAQLVMWPITVPITVAIFLVYFMCHASLQIISFITRGRL
jgi:hypothetical protein